MNIEAIIGTDFPKKVIPLIDNAKSKINIVVYDWRWYPNSAGCSAQLFNQSIMRAIRRGVAVRVVCNIDDVFKYLVQAGAVCRRTVSKNMVHAKMIIIDDEKLVIGSHNYSENAFTMNREISVLIDGLDNFSDYNKFFETLWLL